MGPDCKQTNMMSSNVCTAAADARKYSSHPLLAGCLAPYERFVEHLYLTSVQPAKECLQVGRLPHWFCPVSFCWYEKLKWGCRVLNASSKAFRPRIHSGYNLHSSLKICLSFVMVMVTHLDHFYISVAFHVLWMVFAFVWNVVEAVEHFIWIAFRGNFTSWISLWNTFNETV